MHADIAQQYRVSSQLVSQLVRESVRQPAKLEAKRQRSKLEDDRYDAIEDVATELLAANTPITSARQVREAILE